MNTDTLAVMDMDVTMLTCTRCGRADEPREFEQVDNGLLCWYCSDSVSCQICGRKAYFKTMVEVTVECKTMAGVTVEHDGVGFVCIGCEPLPSAEEGRISA
jgi:ribosomal protein L37E